MAGESYILMGVSGSGKSLIGSKIATLFSAKFIDGDDLHPAKNIDKMSQGIPLTDEDRLPWLERLNDASYSLYKKNETGFIVCSSLKNSTAIFYVRVALTYISCGWTAITPLFCSECSVVPGILCRQTCCKVSLTRWSDPVPMNMILRVSMLIMTSST